MAHRRWMSKREIAKVIYVHTVRVRDETIWSYEVKVPPRIENLGVFFRDYRTACVIVRALREHLYNSPKLQQEVLRESAARALEGDN